MGSGRGWWRAALSVGLLGVAAGVVLLLEGAGGGRGTGAVVAGGCGCLAVCAAVMLSRGRGSGHRGTPGKDGSASGKASRDTRIRGGRYRSVKDDAFLVTVAERPDRPAPGPRTKAEAGASEVRGPVTVVGGREDVELAVRAEGVRVRHKWPSPAGGARWRLWFEERWEAIDGLSFDYGTHDSVVALYAVPADGTRQHVVDARAFTDEQWDKVAAGITYLTAGRLTLDPTGRANPGPVRDT
ncbi:hypothetical protein [Streptomyces sp. NPDC058045]|uniref:hypothetical protein n=1 Tax=Streptomyces sp. NPDC058045 TaxID=3346311 RepID=UPI0036F06026